MTLIRGLERNVLKRETLLFLSSYYTTSLSKKTVVFGYHSSVVSILL